MKTDNINPLIYTLLGLIFWGLIAMFIFKGCSTEPTPQTINKDSLYTIIAEKEQINNCLKNENKQIKAITDSLKALKPKYTKGKDRVRDSLIYVSDSVCKLNLTILYNECQKVDSINNSIISNQETHIMNDSHIIGNLTDIIAIQKYVITSDSVTIDELKMTVKKEKRKGKLKTILGTALGVIGGGLIGSLR